MTRDNNRLGKFHLDGIPPMPRGVSQIEVTFDIDASGILNVSAIEKSTGKEQKITITNDKGRLSADDIEHMVGVAETFKAEDERQRQRIDAKNALENFGYSVRNSTREEKLASKISADDKATIEGAVDEAIAWLDHSTGVEREEKQKALEGEVNPIMMKLHQNGAAASGAPPGGWRLVVTTMGTRPNLHGAPRGVAPPLGPRSRRRTKPKPRGDWGLRPPSPPFAVAT
jgi:heat shock protein 1/8